MSKFLSIINNLFKNLCEIVAWRNSVFFGILFSGEAMMHHRKSENYIMMLNVKGVFSYGKFIFKECLQGVSERF